MIEVAAGTEVPMPDVLASAVTLDPSLWRVEADERELEVRCRRCGHREELHDPERAGQPLKGLVCMYHDSEGPCLCRGMKP